MFVFHQRENVNKYFVDASLYRINLYQSNNNMNSLFFCSFRSSANTLLEQIQQKGGLHVLQTLLSCLHELKLEHRLMAANLLLQLDLLVKTCCYFLNFMKSQNWPVM
jgi:hypothetical protein